ncbi:choice-of-anchor X domain-containing protein [Myxococcus stipitatus]|uniref:choice-of-anchor X domain-containing protein n=1 Tax=Myxococcus stipitatus TaxID=83455 RepID=UPI003AF27D75
MSLCVVLGAVGWWGLGGDAEGAPGASGTEGATAVGRRGPAMAASPGKASGGGGSAGGSVAAASSGAPGGRDSPTPREREREELKALWRQRLERAKRTLESYVAATRYPPQSRPIEEHPDQVTLAEPERLRPLSREHPELQLRLKQDRVFVVGDEAVHFFVSCEDAQRQPRPCQVLSASAHEAEYVQGAGMMPAVPVVFTDDGVGGDAVAKDGVFTGRLQPSKQGFPLFSGTLRVDVVVRSDRAEGTAFLDILYTPSPPATFTGKVREEVSAGSLLLYLGINVRKAGRYVVAGRVDTEGGEPFAHVSFNEELKEGAQEVKLTVFGKLIRDEDPSFPLKLRDVEGFLLKESGDPDRELMATLRGEVHTTHDYQASSFSPDEWQGEVRRRYIDEYTNDVLDAQRQLELLVAEEEGKKPPPGDGDKSPP